MGVIPKKAIDNFLKMPRDDLRKWKKISDRKVEQFYNELPKGSPLWAKMRRVQKICFLIGVEFRKIAFHLDTGSGKTLLSLALAKYLESVGAAYRTLVLVPRNVNRGEWVREIKKHSPETSYVVLSGPSEHKWKLLEGADDEIVIATYAGLVRMVCDLKLVKKGKKQVPKLVLDLKKVDRLGKSLDGFILDESTEVSSRDSLAWRVMRKLSKTARFLIQLTGTPFGKEPTPLWSQMYLIDEGESLGPTLGIFRAAFYKEKDNYWSGFPDYTFDKKKEKLLHRMLAHRSIRYAAEETDLPQVSRIVKEVSITKDIDGYYQKVKKQLIEAHGNYQEMKNAFMRMRQISSGFVGYVDDETGAKASFEFKPNPKLDMLLGIVQSIPEGHKTVIFQDFVFSGSIICRELDRLKIKYARVYGKTKDPEEQLRKFTEDDDCGVFVLNSSAGAFGLNLQIARYIIFYESPVPVIIRKQAERRVERQYSEHEKVFMYDLVTKGTYDQRILDVHKAGGDLFAAIVDGSERP